MSASVSLFSSTRQTKKPFILSFSAFISLPSLFIALLHLKILPAKKPITPISRSLVEFSSGTTVVLTQPATSREKKQTTAKDRHPISNDVAFLLLFSFAMAVIFFAFSFAVAVILTSSSACTAARCASFSFAVALILTSSSACAAARCASISACASAFYAAVGPQLVLKFIVSPHLRQ